ncbi:MAG TPA: hypothetical protein VLS25_07710 [Dehalococcoidia bacterium]|nr:hypothetical protein [Dehalococcoidia bacterium]
MQPVFIGLLFATALTTNALLGLWRSGLPRFSPAWFVAIHASIPLLIAIRLLLIRPTWVIPPEIGLAFVGQFVGARLPSFRRPGLGVRPVDFDNA